MCSKANRRIGFVKRRINYGGSKEIKLLCYTSLIRPLVEYGSIIWNTFNRSQILQLEAIQRRFTKYILGNNDLCYKDRLKECNILPLTMRREYLDYSFLFNCINDKIDINVLNYVEVFNGVVDTRLNADEAMRFKNVYPRKAKSASFYNYRVVHPWNTIPTEIITLELSPNGSNATLKHCL